MDRTNRVASTGFGLQHRLVGLVHQFGHVTGAGFPEGNAEADCPGDFLVADVSRLVRGLAESFCVGGGSLLVGRAGHHGDEFVAAEPGQQMLVGGGLGQPVSEGLQELVAGGVTAGRGVDLVPPCG